MNLHPKHIENVLKMSSFERYQYFLRRIADAEELWTIVDEMGEITLSNIEGNVLMPFWSNESFIENTLLEGWAKCSPFKINLDELEETIFPIIEKNNYLINVFPKATKSGFVVNLKEFIRDLNEELEQYL